MAESNIQQELLRLFQQHQQQPNIELNTGLLAEGQQGLSDVFTNPDQAQVNALVGGLAGLVNPRGRDPALMAVAQGAQAFQNTRMQDYERRVKAEELRQEKFKNQLQGALGIANFGTAQDRIAEDQRQFNATNKLDRDKLKLNRDKFKLDKNETTTEQYIDPASGRIIDIQNTSEGLMYQGQPISPSSLGFAPFSDKLLTRALDNQASISAEGEQEFSRTLGLHQINTNPSIDRVTGRLAGRAVRSAIDVLGAGTQQEVLLRDMKEFTVDSVLEGLKDMGGNDTEKEAARLQSAKPAPDSDKAVWLSYELNEVSDAAFNTLSKGRPGVEGAKEELFNRLDDFSPKDLRRTSEGGLVKPGSVVDKFIRSGVYIPKTKADNLGSEKTTELETRLNKYRGK